ncbi:hypothetical protein [Lysobacter brunescens]|uniref:hypothetical protein n=1 Tax=Lysobacter brunescens TaxID=262323 RepID=UPI0036DA02D1
MVDVSDTTGVRPWSTAGIAGFDPGRAACSADAPLPAMAIVLAAIVVAAIHAAIRPTFIALR